MGGYDLIDLDRGGLGYDKEAIAPDTGQVTGSACFASKWLDFLDPLIEAKLNSTGPVCSPAYAAFAPRSVQRALLTVIGQSRAMLSLL